MCMNMGKDSQDVRLFNILIIKGAPANGSLEVLYSNLQPYDQEYYLLPGTPQWAEQSWAL